MSDAARVGVDQLTFTIYGTDTALAQGDAVRDLYAEIYAEPPYHEGPAEVKDFASGWHHTIDQRNFRLVIARRAGEPIGFAFGFPLRTGTTWWNGALTPLSDEITTEYPGRTFAIIELAVRRPYRQQGIGRQLHTYLTAGLSEERITLLVRPEAPAPQQAYLSWGYQPVGRIQPFPDAPIYDAMIKQLVSPTTAPPRA
ncbi:MAG: GNAT family N-acetyltransferase [Pseudonocardiales bacterium]|nr:GNAT family N-acetyltransferase [Pseudonocardiales bacterium]